MSIYHRLMQYAFVFLCAALLAACGTTATKPDIAETGSVIKTTAKQDGSTETVENLSDYGMYLKRTAETKPLFEMTCPPQGCQFASLKVNAPADKTNVAPPPAPPETEGTAFIKGMFGLGHDIIGLGPWYFGGKVLMKAFDKANASVDNSNRSVTTNTDNSNRSVDNSNRAVTTNTDNSNRSVNNSNNRTCTTGAPVGTTGQTGSSGPASC